MCSEPREKTPKTQKEPSNFSFGFGCMKCVECIIVIGYKRVYRGLLGDNWWSWFKIGGVNILAIFLLVIRFYIKATT